MFPSRSKSVSSSSAPRGPVLMEGILEKKKTFGSTKFYCSLQDGKLCYSEEKGRESIIDISHAQAIREGKAKFSFEIITSSRTHTFGADSQSTRDRWIASLREAMRVSSRKNSTLSYIESANSDEENGAAYNPRSSAASQLASGVKTSSSPTSPLKPGCGASLPVGYTKRTTPSGAPSFMEEAPMSSRTSEMKSTAPAGGTMESPTQPKPASESVSVGLESGKIDGSTVGAVTHSASYEAKEESEACKRVTLSEDAEEQAGRPSASSNSISVENELGTFSKDESEEKGSPTRHSNDDAAAVDSSVTDERVELSPTILYANNADIKKFLNEQNAMSEERKSAAEVVYANNLDIEKYCNKQTREDDEGNSASVSKETDSQTKGRNMESTSEPELQSQIDAARNKDDMDEELDDAFLPLCNQEKDKTEVVRPVLRRPSQPVIEISTLETDAPQPTAAAVELDVEFIRKPIPDLPNPRLEQNWSSAFTEIRAILSTSSTQPGNSALTSVFRDQQGCAVDSLKHFLKNIECG